MAESARRLGEAILRGPKMARKAPAKKTATKSAAKPPHKKMASLDGKAMVKPKSLTPKEIREIGASGLSNHEQAIKRLKRASAKKSSAKKPSQKRASKG